jgi:Ca2+/H+ antiporter
MSLTLLIVVLVAVVGVAKAVSPAIEGAVVAANLPHSVVGVVIALLVLLPEPSLPYALHSATVSKRASTSPSGRRLQALV